MAQENGTITHGALRMLRDTVTRVPVLSTEQDDLCRRCILGKYAKAYFSRNNNREECVLGLIHLDICGPMSTRALSGGKYFVAFIDVLKFDD